MPAFSYTQPIFAPEDEEREQADLTPEERTSILDDMKGRLLEDVEIIEDDVDDRGEHEGQPAAAAEEEDDHDDINPDLIREFATEMDRIPFEDKTDYLQALATNEALFETECNPIRFLRYTDYDAELAATRMTKYWQMRVKLFGVERAFLPMTLTGALHDDLEEWKEHVPNVLNHLPNDVKGRNVICYYRKNITNVHGLSQYIIARMVWYMLHVALQRRFTQINGYVHLHINRITSLSQFDRLQNKMSVKSVTECIPIKVCAIHCFPSGVVAQFISPVMKFFMSKSVRTRTKIHKPERTGSALMQDLHTYGLRREGLPKVIGGSYDIDPNWLQERLEFDEENGL